MSAIKVARRYARALLELGIETNTLDSLVKDIGAVADCYAEQPLLRNVMDNPDVPRTARKAILLDVAQKLSLSQHSRNALALLVDNGRVRILSALASELRREADIRAGVLRAKVTSATPLTDSYVAKLTSALESRFKKKVLVERSVEPSLLAGVVTRIGDTIIDGSLRARLTELKSELVPAV